MRLFVAIFPPEETRVAMSDAKRELRVRGDTRWVRPENIHLTIEFLGEVPEATVPEISVTLESVSGRHAPLEIAPSGFGGFPRIERARVVWIGAGGDLESFRVLADDVRTSLESLGFERDARSDAREFSPHFTLGRAKRKSVGVAVESEPEFAPFEVREISLVKSETRREGASYETLETFRLSHDTFRTPR